MGARVFVAFVGSGGGLGVLVVGAVRRARVGVVLVSDHIKGVKYIFIYYCTIISCANCESGFGNLLSALANYLLFFVCLLLNLVVALACPELDVAVRAEEGFHIGKINYD